MLKILVLLCITILCIQQSSGTIFWGNEFKRAPKNDPVNKGLIAKALKEVHVDRNEIHGKAFFIKSNRVFQTFYKYVYTNKEGETCYIEWSVWVLFGIRDLISPICSTDEL